MADRLRDTEELFRLVVDEAKEFAIFMVDLDAKITSWNYGAERIFGWPEQDILGQHFRVLFTAEDQELGLAEKELLLAGQTGRAADTRWHRRLDGTLFFADGVTSALRADDGRLIGFSKIARDITERIRTEQRVAAQLALTNLLTTSRPFTETARRVMQAVCENLDWDLGVVWSVDESDGVLRRVDLWAAEGLDTAAVTSVGELARGSGFPGLVWESEKPLWIPELTLEGPYPRSGAFAAMGIHAALGFPIMHEGHVMGVMEFFSRKQREPEQALMPILALIGAQIGDYFERYRAAEALRVSEARYRVISDSATDAIFTMDRDSRILFANPAVKAVFGHTPEDLVGQPLEIIIPPRLRESHRLGVARYLETRERHIPWTGVQLPGLHADGHEFPVELSFGFYEAADGEIIFSGFARDITSRERVARQLRESLEHEQQARSEAEASRLQLERRADEETSFRHLASALTGAVEMEDVLHEITNRATLVTRADGVYVERITQPESSVQVVSSFGRGAPPRGTCVDYPGSLTEEIMRGRAPVIVADMRGFGRSMAPYLGDRCNDCEFLVTPLVADEEPLGALVLLNSRASGRTFHEGDIDRARTLGDLASLALRRVRLMEREREARGKAEAAVRVRDETLGIVSHDLRNPLTSIALSAELMAGAPAEEQREHVGTILSATHQMQRLIQDLLDVARVESGGLSVRRSRVDPTALAHRICEANTPLAESRNQRLVCDVPPLPAVDADRDRIVQVFGNLIGNALKFTPEGGEVTVRGYERGDTVVFEVRDTGPGIPESDLRQVFKPYWQAKKTAHMGAGLGLAIVRGIIEAHDGTVAAANVPAGGAVFSFTLPKAT